MPLTRCEHRSVYFERRVFVRSRVARGVLLAALGLAWCSEVAADESAAARLFREGRALLVEGRFAEACSRLEQSQGLEPRLGTQLNVAFCRERLGDLAGALRNFQEAASVARREGDTERERFALSRVEVLASRLRESTLLESTLLESEHAAVTTPTPPAQSAGSVHSPPESSSSSSSESRAVGHFVYELGAFVAYLDVDSSDVSAGERLSDLQVSDEGQTLTCSSSTCSYQFFGSSSGFAVGVAGFVGYALAPDVDLGLRFLLGPRAGGGALIALGPSISFLLAERYRVSPAVFFGGASYSDQGNAELATSERAYDIPARVSASLGFAIGLGSELGFTLSESATGSVVLQATPLFLYGPNGVAWSLPLGAAFRWN